jgi:hypothetical protein
MALDRRRTMARARRGLPNDNPPPPTRESTFPRKLFDDNRPRAVIRAERSAEQVERGAALLQRARQSGRTFETTEEFIRELMGGMELTGTQRVILDRLFFGSGVLRAGTPYRPTSLIRVGDKIVMDNETYNLVEVDGERKPNIKELRLGDWVRFVRHTDRENPVMGYVSTLYADGFCVNGVWRAYRYTEVDIDVVVFAEGCIHMSTGQKVPLTWLDRARQRAQMMDQRFA